jgi:hypothetical protein
MTPHDEWQHLSNHMDVVKFRRPPSLFTAWYYYLKAILRKLMAPTMRTP